MSFGRAFSPLRAAAGRCLLAGVLMMAACSHGGGLIGSWKVVPPGADRNRSMLAGVQSLRFIDATHLELITAYNRDGSGPVLRLPCTYETLGDGEISVSISGATVNFTPKVDGDNLLLTESGFAQPIAFVRTVQ